MTILLVSINDENPEIEKFLIKYLKTAGFKVIKQQNGSIHIQATRQKASNTTEIKKINPQKFIFPYIPKLRKVFEFIELNYHQSIRLKEVAQAVGYSSAYLTDLVRRMTGKTVNGWIIERRIAEAKRLLLETEDSIEQIAVKVGYQSINHFYCQFRHCNQNTPRAWREAHRCKLDYN